jgi:hypothetical protein
MHQALCELAARAGRRGTAEELPTLEFRPSAEVGLKVLGADHAMLRLRARGVVRVVGVGPDCRQVVDGDRLVGLRRRMMRLDPALARELQWAGAKWAALTATCEKNRSSALRSSAAIV